MAGSSKSGARTRKLRAPAWLTFLGWVLIAPALMVGLGIWENGRATADLTDYAGRQARLPANLAKLKQLAAENPIAPVQFSGDSMSYSAAIALSRLEEAASYVDETVLLSRARSILSKIAVGGGATALAASLLGLVAASIAALLARRSREQLVRGFALLRRILPFILLLQLVGLAVGFVGVVLFEIGDLWFQQEISGGEIKLAMCGLIFCGLALYAAYAAVRGMRKVFALLAPGPMEVSGEVMDEAAAPGLWMTVRELARTQQSLMPDSIVIGLTGGFFVTSSAVKVMPGERMLSGRTLYLPAPYLGFLSLRELAAIIGHELAHFSGDDTLYSQRFSPIYQGLSRAIESLGELKGVGGMLLTPSTRLGFHAMSTFDAAVGRWSQRREFEADKLGSTVSGPQAAASALVRTGVIADVIDKVLGQAFEAPAASPSDLVAEIERVADAEGFADPSKHLEDRKPHPTDSHPATRRRIAAFDIAIDDALLAEATRSIASKPANLPQRMVRDWPGLCGRLSATFLERGRTAAAARQTFIEKTAAAMPQGETLIWENMKAIAIIRAVLTVLLFAFAAGLPILAYAGVPDLRQPFGLYYAPAGFAAAGLICLWVTIRAVKRLGQPTLVLDPQGLRSPLVAGIVPWSAVETFKVTTRNNRGFTLCLVLGREEALPQRAAWSMRCRRYRRTHSLDLSVAIPRGMKPNAFAQLIGRYLDATRAGAMLKAKW